MKFGSNDPDHARTDVATARQQRATGAAETDYEVVVIGAGVAGLYQIKRLLDLGVQAIVLEGNEGAYRRALVPHLGGSVAHRRR